MFPYLDSTRDIYYPTTTAEPSLYRAEFYYSIPDDAVGI